MRNLTINELEIVNGGATLAESAPYKIAGLIVNTILPVLNFLPFIGAPIANWLKAEQTLSDGSVVNAGQKFLGGLLSGLLTPPALPAPKA